MVDSPWITNEMLIHNKLWSMVYGLSTMVKLSSMNHELLTVPTMAEMAAQGKEPEILFWVGCAGSFDERAQKITRDICKILQHVGISFAVLGTEESCSGDPAKR